MKRWRDRLDTQIVALFLGLLLAVQAVSFLLIRHSIDSNARAALQEDLAQSELIFQRLLEQNADHLEQASRVLAADYGFRSAIASDDRATLASALANHGARLGAHIALFTTTRFELRASAGEGGSEVLPHLRRLTEQETGPSPATRTAGVSARSAPAGVLLIGSRPHQVVAVPVRAPLPIGWVVMGFPLDETLLQDMRKLGGVDAMLLGRAADGRWVPALSTAQGRRAADALATRWNALPAQTPFTVQVEDADYLGSRLDLDTQGTRPVAAALLLSVDAAVAPYRRLQVGVLVLTALGVLVFALGSVVTARRITTPLSALTRLARRLGSGDFAVAVPTAGGDEIGQLAEAFESMRVAIRERETEITRLAFVDGLTDLPNRLQFARDVHAAAQRAQVTGGRPCAVLLLNLDRFKHVNDVLGHEAGDRVLRELASRLGRALKANESLARLGADQFALLLQDCDRGALELAVPRLEAVLHEPLLLDDQRIDLSAGIGAALCPEHASDGTMLLRRAEIALARAKLRQHGAVVFEPDMDATSAQSLSLLSELRSAVADHQLRLFLQPKVLMGTAEVMGAEALVRWDHPLRGLVPPMQFIPFAEQTGFIRQLTHWLLQECARTWRSWADQGLMLELSLNLSARDLIDQDLPQKVAQALQAHRVDPRALCLEITESSIMDDPQRALQTLEQLHELGLRLAIDDFGTGYSSLAYLKRLPVHELKIDQSFVKNMERDMDDAKIVRSTIDLAHNLGLKVVAEGIETAAAWKLLSLLACDQGQGYWISRPMPAEQFPEWARNWQRPAAVDTLRLPSDFAKLVP